MTYRIVELERQSAESLDGATLIGKYDSAYRAMEEMKRAFLRCKDNQPPNWYLLDYLGHILAGPEDVIEAVCS